MRGITSFLRWSWVALVGFLVAIVQIAAFPFFNPWTDPRRRLAERLNQLWARGVLWTFPNLHIDVTGLELIQQSGPYVLCANHRSMADIVMLLATCPRMKFIAKRAIFMVPMFGISMLIAGYVISGTGGKSTDRAMRRSLGWLKRGCHVLTFPEGTRAKDDQLLRFRQGAFVLAREGGVQVLPVAISGTRELLTKGEFSFTTEGRVRIRFLSPEPVDTDPKRVASRVRARIQEALG